MEELEEYYIAQQLEYEDLIKYGKELNEPLIKQEEDQMLGFFFIVTMIGIALYIYDICQEIIESKSRFKEYKKRVEEARQIIEEARQMIEEARQMIEENRQMIEETRQMIEESKQWIKDSTEYLEIVVEKFKEFIKTDKEKFFNTVSLDHMLKYWKGSEIFVSNESRLFLAETIALTYLRNNDEHNYQKWMMIVSAIINKIETHQE